MRYYAKKFLMLTLWWPLVIRESADETLSDDATDFFLPSIAFGSSVIFTTVIVMLAQVMHPPALIAPLFVVLCGFGLYLVLGLWTHFFLKRHLGSSFF